MSEKDKKLFAEFPPVSTDAWMEKVHKDLKGKNFEKLVWKPLDGIKVRPFYREEDVKNIKHLYSFPGEYPYVRGNKIHNNEWFIRQDIKVEKPADANKIALNVLNKGINSLGFVCDNLLSKQEMEILLKDIAVDSIEVNFIAGANAPEILDAFIAVLKDRNYQAERIIASVDYSPLADLCLTGNYTYQDENKAFDTAKSLIETAKGYPNLRVVGLKADIFHNSGSTTVQELGFALSAAAEYLDKLTEKGLKIDDITRAIKFTFASGSNYFMEIAKYRAARLLWAQMTDSYQPETTESSKMYTHSVTSSWNKTIYDPYVNMLRTTTEAMSAVLGGVDSLTVEAFNKIFEAPTEFSQRIARNQQILLKEEAYFDKIVDPAAGSYYIESLTESIASEAWKLFLEIEEVGGFTTAYKTGTIQQKITEIVQKRDINIATRREVLVGTNQFPNFGEKLDPAQVDDELINPVAAKADNTIAQPLIPYRGAIAFEQMRLKTDRSDKQPKAFMLTYGHPAMRSARSTFSRNFFACAGFEVIDNPGFKTIEEGIKAAKDADADIIVICSADNEYPNIAPQVKQQAGNAIVVVAGYPKDAIDELKAKGIKHFIHIKSNVLETLKEFQQLLGIE